MDDWITNPGNYSDPIRKTAVSQRSLLMWLLRHIKSVKCALECKHSDHIYQILHGSE